MLSLSPLSDLNRQCTGSLRRLLGDRNFQRNQVVVSDIFGSYLNVLLTCLAPWDQINNCSVKRNQQKQLCCIVPLSVRYVKSFVQHFRSSKIMGEI